jgi:hypothetical protein
MAIREKAQAITCQKEAGDQNIGFRPVELFVNEG